MSELSAHTLHTIVFKGGVRAAWLFDDATYAQLTNDRASGLAVGSYDVLSPDDRTLRICAFRFADVEDID